MPCADDCVREGRWYQECLIISSFRRIRALSAAKQAVASTTTAEGSNAGSGGGGSGSGRGGKMVASSTASAT
jgi:uncharacterized membrane protein